MGVPMLFTALSAGSTVAKGVSGMQAARGDKIRAETNAYISRTRAMMVNAHARTGLEAEVGTMRNNLAANGQEPSSATFSILSELRSVRGRERRMNQGNENRKALDYDMAAKNAGTRATGAFVSGIGGAAPSLYDLSQQI